MNKKYYPSSLFVYGALFLLYRLSPNGTISFKPTFINHLVGNLSFLKGQNRGAYWQKILNQ